MLKVGARCLSCDGLMIGKSAYPDDGVCCECRIGKIMAMEPVIDDVLTMNQEELGALSNALMVAASEAHDLCNRLLNNQEIVNEIIRLRKIQADRRDVKL